MYDPTDLENRLERMETHAAHQESTIQDLSDIIAGQAVTIAGLACQVERLKERLLALEDDLKTAIPKDPVPPHY